MSFVYDDAGRRTQRTDYNGAVTGYTYDAINRPTQISYSDTTSASYGYDALSRLTSASNPTGTVTFSYDVNGRVVSTKDVWGKFVSYGYDANGNRAELKLDGGLKASYNYDEANRLTRITDSAGAIVSYGYDVVNRLTSKQLPNGVGTVYQYDDMNRLTRLTDAAATGTVADFQYQFNTASQIIQQIDQAGTHTYGYDVVNRLTSTTHTSLPAESYAYDGVGNRTASHQSATYTYDPFNRLKTTVSAAFSFDSNGNLLSKTPSTGTQLGLTWDHENRLVTGTPSGGPSVSYKYDALGRRVERATSAGDWTKYTYDGQDVLLDQRSDGSTVEYLNGPGIDNKIRQKDSSTVQTLYYTQDHLGSTRALTDASGSVVERIDYDSFGQSTNSLYTRYLYTGRELDSATDLYYYRARWYDAQHGRFISEDPIGLMGGINMYAYVINNPLGYSDPLGLCPQKPACGPIHFEPGQVYLCKRRTEINGVYSIVNSVASHFWLRTDEKEAGLGPLGGGVPGQNAPADSPYVTQTSINDHKGESERAGVCCEKVGGADPVIVNRELETGKRMGRFSPTNNCFTFVNQVIWKARGLDKRNPYWDAIQYGIP
jgi:RHS repeat-associated protein